MLALISACAAAPAFADPINLMWDASADPVNGYIVYVGSQSGTYTVKYDVGTATAFTYSNAVAGQRYCFAVTAYSAGSEGVRSSEICGYSDAPPTLANPGNQSSAVGSPVSLQLAGSDPYGQPVSYSAAGLPPGLTISSSSGLITGVGTAAGTYAVTARAFDGRLAATQPFTWTMVQPVIAAPVVAIVAPTAAATYASAVSALTLSGTASAGAGVAEVRWSNDRGGSGTASGTTSWTAGSIPLQIGSNVLTVVAVDGRGQQAADVLTVSYTAPATTVTLSARSYVQKGKKTVELTWTGCSWSFVDVVRDNLPLTTTTNDGGYTDSMKKGGTYTYKLCQPGSRTNCSNSVAVYF